jgi:hypothetical protein
MAMMGRIKGATKDTDSSLPSVVHGWECRRSARIACCGRFLNYLSPTMSKVKIPRFYRAFSGKVTHRIADVTNVIKKMRDKRIDM